MEHDSVQRKLLRPDLICDYNAPEHGVVGGPASGDLGFSIAQNHTVIEASLSTERAEWRKPVGLSSPDLLAWMQANRTMPARNSVQVLFCQPIPARAPTLSVPQNFIEELQKLFDVPAEFFRILHRSLPAAFRFETTEARSGSRMNGVIIRNQSAWVMEYTLLHIHSLQRNASLSICFGLTSIEIRKLLAFLASSQRSGVCHLLFPILLMDESIEASSSLVHRRRETIEHMQQEIDLDLFLSSPADTDANRTLPTDIQLISKRLTSFSTSVATLVCSAKAQRRFVLLLSKILREAPICSKRSKAMVESLVIPKLESRLKYLEETTVAIGDEGEFLQTSIQSQVQTVYNLIAQSESYVQRDISERSMLMTRLAQRDGSNMRVIAIVTLVFLPGTFTATLFSTTFFDFKPGIPQSRNVSPSFWVYWVVAGCLTLFVLAAWLFTIQFEKKTLKVRLWDANDSEKRISGGLNATKTQRIVNERFEYDVQDTKMLDKYLSTLSTTTVSANGLDQMTASVTMPSLLAISLPSAQSSGTFPSISSSTEPAVPTASADPNNSDLSKEPSSSHTASSNTNVPNENNLAPASLTAKAKARLQKLEDREREERARIQREKQVDILNEQSRRKVAPVRSGRQGYN